MCCNSIIPVHNTNGKSKRLLASQALTPKGLLQKSTPVWGTLFCENYEADLYYEIYEIVQFNITIGFMIILTRYSATFCTLIINQYYQALIKRT